MPDNTEKISRFEEVINGEVSVQVEKLFSEAKKMAEASLKSADDAYLEESYHTVSNKTKQLRSDAERRVSQHSFTASKEIIAHRNSLVEKFFDDILADVETFTKTEKYSDYMASCLSSANSENPFYDGVTALVRQSDVELAEKLAKKSFPKLIVKAGKNIKLGGVSVFYPMENQYTDRTLDDAFQKQKNGFVNNAEMQL